MDLLLLNIKELVQTGENPPVWLAGKEMSVLSTLKNAFLLVSDEMIVDYGPMEALGDCTACSGDLLMEIDCKDRLVFPSFCDPDSHLLYPFAPLPAFSKRHPERAKNGVSFLDTILDLHEMSVDEIYVQALDHLKEVVGKGTGAIEIKSGYGLDVEDEIKLLQVIRKLKQTTPLVIKSTFLGSHTYPESFRRSPARYLDHILDILPAIARDELADNLDLYYDQQFLSRSESETLLLAGLKEGLNVKIHSDELGLNRLNESNLSTALDILQSNEPITRRWSKMPFSRSLCPEPPSSTISRRPLPVKWQMRDFHWHLPPILIQAPCPRAT
jgi:imidazolonepropionase